MLAKPFYEMIQPDGMYRASTYDHGMRAGNMLFVAGQVGRNADGDLVGPHDATAQARVAHENLRQILEAAGSGFDQVVSVKTFYVNPDDIAKTVDIRREYFGDHRPPHTGNVISMLGSPDVRFEIEVIAMIPESTGEYVMADPNFEMIQPEGMHRALTYDHGLKTGNLLFVAGQVGVDRDGNLVEPFDPEAQARQAFENLKRVLNEAGADFSNVVKVTTMCVDTDEFPVVTKVRQEYFGNHRPPHTGIVISQLGSPATRFEVEVIAVLPPEST